MRDTATRQHHDNGQQRRASRLTGPEFFTWLGLRRVRRGRVTQFEGRYYDAGHPIPGCLYSDVFGALIEAGLLALADPDECGLALVTVTGSGQARYRVLGRRQRGTGQLPNHTETGGSCRAGSGPDEA